MAIETANFIQAAGVLIAGGATTHIAGGAGIKSFTYSGVVGEYDLELTQPLDVKDLGGPVPAYNCGVLINTMQPVGAGQVRAFILVDQQRIRIFATDVAGDPANVVFAAFVVFQLPQAR